MTAPSKKQSEQLANLLMLKLKIAVNRVRHKRSYEDEGSNWIIEYQRVGAHANKILLGCSDHRALGMLIRLAQPAGHTIERLDTLRILITPKLD